MADLTDLRNEECWSLLRAHHVGRIAVVVDRWPTILPINYTVDGMDRIAARTTVGSLLSTCAGRSVGFEVDEFDTLYSSGWSVLVAGELHSVVDPEELRRLEASGLRSWGAAERHCWIRIVPSRVTGRRLPAAWHYPMPMP